jgi:uncharacterized protein YbjT (DUF2867 family)
MQKILLFGGTGNAGMQIAQVLHAKGYITTAVIRNSSRSAELEKITSSVMVADIADKNKILNICNGYDVVISPLGKSVSPFNRSKGSFRKIDYEINLAILMDAKRAGVKKFIYLSAFHAEKYPGLEFFKVHQDFSAALADSSINYSIIKPPALYSAFKDLFPLAKKGLLVTLGDGEKKTNPIYEGDLATIVVDAINDTNNIIEAGGPETLTRHEINLIIQNEISPGGRIRKMPLWIIRSLLPVLKMLDRNTYDKLAFFLAVMEEDTIAPPKGRMPFSEYVRTNK